MNCLSLGDDCDALSVSAAQEIREFGVFPGLKAQKVRHKRVSEILQAQSSN